MRQRNVLIQVDVFEARQKLGIGRYAKEHGWHLTLDDRLSLPRGWTGDGVIVLLRDRDDLVRYVRRLAIPVVDTGIFHPELKLPRVIGDQAQIGRVAAEHFASCLFQRAAWFSNAWSNVHRLRYEGFCAAWPHPPVPRWVWSERAPSSRFDHWATFARWLGRLLDEAPKPLAVFAFDDYDAARVHDVCANSGIAVPEEVAIVGVDNNEMICENQTVPLASVRHDLEEIGYQAAALLDRLMDGARAPRQPRLVPPKGLAVRQSSDVIAVAHPVVRQALVHIKENLHRRFGAQQIAEALKVPRSTLDLAFSQALGRSIGAEIQRQRVARAKVLLLDSALKVYEVARATGFCNASHLNHLFLRAVGQTPLRFRQAKRAPAPLR